MLSEREVSESLALRDRERGQNRTMWPARRGNSVVASSSGCDRSIARVWLTASSGNVDSCGISLGEINFNADSFVALVSNLSPVDSVEGEKHIITQPSGHREKALETTFFS